MANIVIDYLWLFLSLKPTVSDMTLDDAVKIKFKDFDMTILQVEGRAVAIAVEQHSDREPMKLQP